MSLVTVSAENYLSHAGMDTLVFAVTALDLLMNPFLHLTLEDTGSRWLIEPCNFENMCRIDPVIRPPSHNTVGTDLELIHRDLVNTVRSSSHSQGRASG